MSTDLIGEISMHAFPWWGELLINAIVLLTTWQFWLVFSGVVALVVYKSLKKNKALDK